MSEAAGGFRWVKFGPGGRIIAHGGGKTWIQDTLAEWKAQGGKEKP